MIKIVFEPHATTVDNEAKRASGWNDVELSELGIQQAKELGERRKLDDFDAVFCSDLQRAYKTATIAFDDNPLKIFMDWRLRECNYGDFTGKPSSFIEVERPRRITEPFPSGESYEQTAERMWSFLGDLSQKWQGRKVLLIGHRATHYALDHWINEMPLDEAVVQKFVWQPGWEYELE
ncbi:histidine phosphatase family protein [Candidatus Saccharibacteria bacterium]|nr:histidine phosphatase family protein [Candidatus Saccharibacteria bacterium]